MNFLNVGTRQSSEAAGPSPLRAASQRIPNLLKPNVSTPSFGKTLHEVQASPSPPHTSTPADAQRQNLVTGVSSSRASLPKGASQVAVSGGAASAPQPAGNVPESAATGLFEQIIASEKLTAGASTSPKVQQGPAPTPPTPAAPPTLYVLTQTPSTDPGVYATDNYSKELNYSLNEAQANDENVRRYQNYLNAFQNWQLNGSQGDPPKAPVYESVDRNGFDQWWAELQQNMSAPDVSMFLVNGPNCGNGYYGAPGSGQVGTLYNATGPATADQVQAANNATSNSTTHSVHV